MARVEKLEARLNLRLVSPYFLYYSISYEYEKALSHEGAFVAALLLVVVSDKHARIGCVTVVHEHPLKPP